MGGLFRSYGGVIRTVTDSIPAPAIREQPSRPAHARRAVGQSDTLKSSWASMLPPGK